MGGLLGVDLDNTIIDYGPAYAHIAESLGLPASLRDRSSIRETLRLSGADDEKWQEFQSVLYTDGLELAVPAEGVFSFLDLAVARQWQIAIVSHKTERTPEKFGGLPLRAAAVEWLHRHAVVPDRCALDQVYFEPTQRAKISRITRLGCDIFVDDLDTIVFHRDRPGFTQMVQYVPRSQWTPGNSQGVAGHGDFQAIVRWLSEC